jgi:tape measure domain-containing protein
MSIDVASVSISTQLNLTGFNSGLVALERTKIKSLEVDVKLNTESLERDRKQLEATLAKPLLLTLEVDDTALMTLRRRLQRQSPYKVKVTTEVDTRGIKDARQQISDSIGSIPEIKICVDDSRLYDLNKHVELKRTHVKDVNVWFKRNPIKIWVDDTEIKNKLNKTNNSTTSSFKSTTSPVERQKNINVSVDTKGIETVLGKLKEPKQGLGGRLLDSVTAPIKGVGKVLDKVVTGALEGVGRPLGDEVGQGIKEGIQRETGDIIGSFKLISKEIGAEVSKGIIESLGDDADKIKATFQAALGKQAIAVEAASQRQQLGRQRQVTQRQAAKQIQTEFDFVKANMPAVKERGTALQQQREALTKQQIELQAKITETADALGVKNLQARLDELKQSRSQIIEQMSSAEDSASIEVYQAQLAKLKDSYINVESSIESINRRAAKRYQSTADKLAQKNEQLSSQERAFGKLISPIENIDFVDLTKTVRKKSKVKVANNTPEVYRQIAQEVGNASGVAIDAATLPKLSANANLPKSSFAQYVPGENEVQVPPEVYEAIKKGELNSKQFETLVHELRHAVQFGFGKKDVNAIRTGTAKAEVQLIKPVADELKQFRRNIEGSVKEQEPEFQNVARGLEADAYAFAARNTADIHKRVSQSARVAKFESSVGIGGAKAETLFKQSQLQALKKLQGIKAMMPDMGLDESSTKQLEQNFTQTLKTIYELDNHLEDVLDKAANVEFLPINEIDALEQNLLEQVSKLNQVANQQAQGFFEQLKTAKANQELPKQSTLASKTTGLSFADTLKQDYTAKGLRDVASKLNIGGLGSANKETLVKAIAVAREHNQKQVEQVLDLLGDSIRKKSSTTGNAKTLPKLEGFADIKSVLQQTDQEIKQAMQMLATAQEEERKDLLQAIVEEAEKQIAWIDELSSKFDLAGSEKQSLTAYRNLFVKGKAAPNAELMDIRTAQINKNANSGRVSGGTAQSVNTTRGNSFDGYHSVADIQEDIDQLFRSVKGNADETEQAAYHSVEDVQQAVDDFLKEILLKLRPDATVPLNQKEIEASVNTRSNTALPLPDDDVGAQAVVNLRNTLDEFDQIEAEINQRLEESTDEINNTLAGIGEDNETIVGRIKRIYRAFQDEGAIGGLQSLKANVGSFIKALLGFKTLSFLLDTFKQFAPALVEASSQMESLERRFGFVSGSAAEGAKNLAFVREEVKRLGTDIKSSMEGFSSLAGATRDTALEGEATKQIFSGVSQASTVYDLTAEQQQRVFTATQQIASKGKVSSEELRQQLGESLPGAFQIAARAMNVTTQQLNKMLEQGQVLSEDFLPKFAQQLSAETATGVAGAANSSVSALIGFNNAVFETQAALGKQLMPARNFGLNVLSEALKFAKDNADILMSGIQFLSIMMGVNAIKAIWSFAGGLKILGGQALLSSAGLKLLGVAAKNALMSAAPMLVLFAGFKVVSEIFEKISFSFTDAGGKIRDFAETSKKSLTDFRKSLKEAKGEQEGFTGGLTKKQLIKNQRDKDREGSFLWNVTGFNFIRNNITKPLINPRETLKKQETDSISIGDRFRAIGQRFGDLNKPKAIKELDDKVAAVQDAIKISDQRIGESKGTQFQGIIKEVQGIDKQLKSVQMRRRASIALNPQDVDTVKRLKQEEGNLLKNRERLYKPIGAMQSQYQADIDGFKSALEEFDQLKKDGNIDDATYNKETSNLKTQLEKAEKAQKAFNASVGKNIDSVALLAKQFQEVNDRLADAAKSAEMGANIQKAAVYSNVNITDEQRNFKINEIDISLLQKQYNDSILAFREQQALLMTQENIQTLSAYGVTKQTGAAQLKTLAERAEEGSPEAKLFEQYGSLKEQHLKVSELQALVAQRRAETQKQLVDLNKQVIDYYRGIARQAAESDIQLAKQASDLENQQFANNIAMAMSGAGDNIITQFVSGIVDAVNQIAQAADGSFDAQSQILQAQNAFEDTFRSGEELRKQLPALELKGSDLPTIPVKIDVDSVGANGDIKELNTEIGKSVDETKALESATFGFNAVVAESGGLIDANTASVGQLESGVTGVTSAIETGTAATDSLNQLVTSTTDSAASLQTQIDTNTVSIDASNTAMQGVGTSIDANTQKTVVTTEQTGNWWTRLSDVYKATGSISAVFEVIGTSIMGAISKTVDWFKTFANNYGILDGIGKMISGWGQSIANSGIGQAVGGLAQQGGNLFNQAVGTVKGALGMGKGVGNVGKYKILESVGSSIQEVNSYRDLEKHHPSAGREAGRNYGTVDGEFEEIRNTGDGRTLVKKDFILVDQKGSQSAIIPSMAAGFVRVLNDAWNTVQIFADKEMTKLVGQSLHQRSVAVKTGDYVRYGQSLGIQGDTGSPGAIHAHIETEVEQFKKYIQDLKDGVFEGTTGKEQAHTLGDGHNHFGEEDIKKANQKGAGAIGGSMNKMLESMNAPQAPTTTKGGVFNPFAGGSNSFAARVVGHSEGNRTPTGGYTDNYKGHSDPANRQLNVGSFSMQTATHGMKTPEQADIYWQGKLQGVWNTFVSAAQRAGLDPNNPTLAANFLDLYTQSPAAATEGVTSFLNQLPKVKAAGATQQSILKARLASFHNASGRLEAWTDLSGLTDDQNRRMAALNAAIPHAPKTGVSPSVNIPSRAVASQPQQAAYTPVAKPEVWTPQSLSATGNAQITQAQTSAKQQQDAQQAAAAQQSYAKAESDTISGIQKSQQVLIQVQKQLRQAGYESRDVGEDVAKMNLDNLGPLTLPQQREQAINEQRRQYRDQGEKINELIIDRQNRKQAAQAILDLPEGIITPAIREKFDKILAMPISEDLKKRLQTELSTGSLGEGLKTTLQQSVGQADKELAILRKAQGDLRKGEQESLKATQEKYAFEEKARANAAKFEQESLNISTLQARLEQMKAQADREGTGSQILKQIPAYETLIALRQEQLNYDKQIQEIEEKVRAKTGINENDAKAQIVSLKQKKAITEQTIKENQAYQELTNARALDARNREIAFQAAKDELAIQKQKLETIKALPSTDARRNDIPLLEYQIDLQELQLKLQEDIAAVNESVFKDPSTKDAGEARIVKLKEEFKLNQANLGIRLKQQSVEQELAQQRAVLGIREQELGYAEQLLEAQSRSIELGRTTGDKLGDRYALQAEQQKLSFEKQILDVKEMGLQSGKSAEEIAAIEAQLRKVNDITLDNIRGEMDKAFKDRAIAVQQRISESTNSSLSAKQSLMSTYGFSQEASRIGKELAVNQQVQDFTAQSRELDEFIKTNAVAADKAALLRDNLKSVNDIKFKEIEAQFNPLKGVIDSSIGALRGAFKSLIKDGKIDFDSFFDGILDSIADFLSNMLVEQLMGFLSPDKDKTKGGAVFPNATENPDADKPSDFTSLLGIGDNLLGDLGTTPVQPLFVSVVNTAEFGIAKGGANNIVPFNRSNVNSSFSLGGFGGSLFGNEPDYISATTDMFGNLGGLFSPGLPPVSSINPFPVGIQQAKPNIFQGIFGGLGGGTGGLGGILGGIASSIGGGGGFGGILGAVLPLVGSLFGGIFAKGGVIGTGRGEKDDQLILAQRGEGILTHEGMKAIGGAAVLNSLNHAKKFRIPVFANGGQIEGEYGGRGSADRVSEGREERRNEPIKLETTIINGVEYATIDQVKLATQQARADSTRDSVKYVSNKMENSVSWRNRHGLR